MNSVTSLTNLLWKSLRYCVFLIMISALLLELIFRLLPVSDSLKTYPVNERSPIIHFKENRTLTLQTGFDFSHVVKKRSNNFGYLTDGDFVHKRAANQERIAIIGDSYVEAIQVANEDTFHGQLALSHQEIQFYPFGASGSPLSQYLAFAKFVSETFDPTKFLFVIIDNDFDESWLTYKDAPTFHFFDNHERLIRRDYAPSLLKRILRESSFVRYLAIDLKIGEQKKRFTNWVRANYFWNEPTDNKSSNEQGAPASRDLKSLNSYDPVKRSADQLRAAHLFLEQLENIVDGRPVLLVLDGDRDEIYREGNSKRNGSVSNAGAAFDSLAGANKRYPNITVLDMHPIFFQDWEKYKEPFDYPYDSHWNERAHALVASSIIGNGFLYEK